MTTARYRGRFAPSPTGPLHAGSLVAALASWLDARAQGGDWLVRIEDVDTPRCVPGADAFILEQLAVLGLTHDEPPLWQSSRHTHYEAAVAQLLAEGWAYPCGCSRSDIVAALAARGEVRERHGDLVYPGTCHDGLHGKPARAVRLRAAPSIAWHEAGAENASASAPTLRIDWHDRRLGAQHQDVALAVGDFVLKRADGLWAYQLAVVVDDAAQGITHVVRGEDLADSTPRQLHLQHVLGLPAPRYLHTPLVLGADREKLSKQNGAQALDLADPLEALRQAGAVLGLYAVGDDVSSWLADATSHWAARWIDAAYRSLRP